MDMKTFCDRVDASGSLKGVGITDNSAIISNTEHEITYDIPFDSIENLSWGELSEILIECRNPSILQHMTRIVGYFSRISNWNDSKMAELSDRHKGQYAINR